MEVFGILFVLALIILPWALIVLGVACAVKYLRRRAK